MISRERELSSFYLFVDLVLLNISMLIAFSLFGKYLKLDSSIDFYSFLHGNISWIIAYKLLAKKNLYLRDGFHNRIKRISKRTFVFILVALALALIFLRATFSLRLFFIYTAILYFLKIIFYGFLYWDLQQRRKQGKHVARCIIVGKNDIGRSLRKLIDYNPILGYKFLGFVEKDAVDEDDTLAGLKDLESLIADNCVEMVFVTPQFLSEKKDRKNFINICSRQGTRLRFMLDSYLYRSRFNIETISRIPLINPMEIPLDSLSNRLLKRSFDVLCSFLVIVLLLSWLMPVIALIIKLTSKGPVFFVQERTGFNNRPFKCLKFRSMYVNGEADTKQATAGDCRITPFGEFMRKWNIDEFPQFLNVFVGDMSIVGPRPHMLKHTEIYSGLVHFYLKRHFVKPGITGWAQVNGLRGETDELWKMQKRVEYDMDYIENWSFYLDLKIIYYTVFGRKAYENAG